MKNHTMKYKGLFFGIIIAIVISLVSLFVSLSDHFDKPEFNIKNYEITAETTDYEYTKDFVSYSGTGEVVSDDADNIYNVFVKATLDSGGNKSSSAVDYYNVLVENGIGKFTTYDSGDKGTVSEPAYDFEVIAYEKYDKY